MEYPTNNPTQEEDELNYLAGVYMSDVYLAMRRGEISQNDYELLNANIQKQKQFVVDMVNKLGEI